MDLGIIVTGHGKMASGILSGLEMIAGKNTNIIAIDFLQTDDYKLLDGKFEEAYNKLKDKDGIMVCCDILGGTPFSRAYTNLKDKKNTRFIAGANFNMIYNLLNSSADNLDDIIDSTIEKSRLELVEYE
ncbi:PTS sugar transporter subunit IIA [uncultured Anaerococcus sp.]|uniref:PTS sugar transporter subunit IIA n=1 Tax=uncultured Anaerococcus sp. TaxID=293428 RepID=UPI0026098F75|nr:PTS sugar transporter subunit IIA [uncultured Anaerococcus sp.]